MMGDPQIRLAGIMSGRFNDIERLLEQPAPAVQRQEVNEQVLRYTLGNLGIAGVVPAHLLQETILSEDLVEHRRLHGRASPKP